MQRADVAGSTRGRCASCGNDAPISGHVTDLVAIPITELTRESGALSYDLCRAKTLLRACGEVLSEATDDTGFWPRDATYHRDRMEHLYDLVAMAEDMVLSAERHMNASDEVIGRARKTAFRPGMAA